MDQPPPPDPSIPGLEQFSLVGWGGFGAVYRAHQPSLRRDVAVKVIVTAGMDQKIRHRFAREQEAMGSLSQHPGIVTLHESGFTGAGMPYLVMELMEGGSLTQRLAESGPLEWEEAVRVMIPICEAVAEAHRAGVLHRDIKPDNILISRYGEPKLSDFGISALLEGTVTATTTVTATVEHAAPEILDAQPPTPQSDIYSLGSTLHTLLTGSSPHRHSADDTMMSILRRVATEPIPPIDGIPDELQAILNDCLATDPGDRPGTSEQVADRLRGLLDDTTRVAAITPAAGVAAATAAGNTESEPTRAIHRDLEPEPDHPNRRRLITIAAVIGLLFITLIALATTTGDNTPLAADATTSTQAANTTEVTTTAEVATTSTPEAITTTEIATTTSTTVAGTTTSRGTRATTTASTATATTGVSTTTATAASTTTAPSSTTTTTTIVATTTTGPSSCSEPGGSGPYTVSSTISPDPGNLSSTFTLTLTGGTPGTQVWADVDDGDGHSFHVIPTRQICSFPYSVTFSRPSWTPGGWAVYLGSQCSGCSVWNGSRSFQVNP